MNPDSLESCYHVFIHKSGFHPDIQKYETNSNKAWIHIKGQIELIPISTAMALQINIYNTAFLNELLSLPLLFPYFYPLARNIYFDIQSQFIFEVNTIINELVAMGIISVTSKFVLIKPHLFCNKDNQLTAFFIGSLIIQFPLVF